MMMPAVWKLIVLFVEIFYSTKNNNSICNISHTNKYKNSNSVQCVYAKFISFLTTVKLKWQLPQ
jgi:hypothetical protein